MPAYSADFDSWWYDAMYDGDYLDCTPSNGDTLTRYFIRVNQTLPTLLERYGSEMVADGLNYSYRWYSYLGYVLSNQWRGERTLRFLDSLKDLYSDGFNRFCYYSFDQKCHPLNSVCCNLWYMGLGDDFARETPIFIERSLDVLRFALQQDNPACQRSALQGLGMLLYATNDIKTKAEIHVIAKDFLSRDIFPKARKRARRLLQ